MTTSIETVITRAQELVGEAAGPGTQMYGEDRMMRDCIRCFDLLFKKYPWPQFREWYSGVLDGTLGQLTTLDFTQIRDFEDIFWVSRSAAQVQLPIMPTNMNPYALTSATDAMYWTAMNQSEANYYKYMLQFYPVTATTTINIGAMRYPVTITNGEPVWAIDDIIDLDENMLVYGTAWMTLNGDDLNPSAAQANQELMDMQFDIITKQLARHPRGGSGSSIPSDWRML